MENFSAFLFCSAAAHPGASLPAFHSAWGKWGRALLPHSCMRRRCLLVLRSFSASSFLIYQHPNGFSKTQYAWRPRCLLSSLSFPMEKIGNTRCETSLLASPPLSTHLLTVWELHPCLLPPGSYPTVCEVPSLFTLQGHSGDQVCPTEDGVPSCIPCWVMNKEEFSCLDQPS